MVKVLAFLLLIVLLLVAALEDFRHRAISLLVLVGMAAIVVYLRMESGFSIVPIAATLSITAMQVLVLFVMYRIKTKKWENIVNKYFGLGDLLFLVILALFFPPMMFLIFEVAGCLMILLYCMAESMVKKMQLSTFKNIPFAGMLSILLAFVLVVNELTWKVDLHSDDYLMLRYFYGY